MTDTLPADGSVDRVGAFLEALSRLAVDDLVVLALPEPDPDERAALIARAEDAAQQAGRLGEVRRAAERASDAVVLAFSFRAYDPTWLGLNWGRSLGRAADRARLVMAIEDAAIAAVVADLLSEEDLALLREPFERVAAMAGSAASASPRIDATHGRRGVLAAAFVLGALMTATVGGGLVVLVLLAARPRSPRDRP